MKINTLGLMDVFLDQIEEIQRRYDHLKEVEKEFHLKLMDIQHLIEFYDFNACQNSKIITIQKKILRDRRLVKNEIAELKPLVITNKLTMSRDGNAYKAIAFAHKLNSDEDNNKEYKVRVMHDLLGETLSKSSDKPAI